MTQQRPKLMATLSGRLETRFDGFTINCELVFAQISMQTTACLVLNDEKANLFLLLALLQYQVA